MGLSLLLFCNHLHLCQPPVTERQELKEFWKDKDLNMVFSTTSLLYRTCPLTYLTDLFEVCKTNIGWDPDTTLKPYLLGARGRWGQQ